MVADWAMLLSWASHAGIFSGEFPLRRTTLVGKIGNPVPFCLQSLFVFFLAARFWPLSVLAYVSTIVFAIVDTPCIEENFFMS